MFFTASKVVWFLLQPSSLCVLALIGGTILMRTSWQRSARALVTGATLALVLFGLSPLSNVLIKPLEERFPRPDSWPVGRVDGIVVVGGAEDTRGAGGRELMALNEAAERLTEAVALARRHPEARVVLSGGSTALLFEDKPAAEAAAELVAALGVTRDRITVENRSRNTHENALFTRELVAPKPGERWLLVTSAWHMPRAIGCFRRAGFAIEPWPVDYRAPSGLRLALPLNNVADGLRRTDLLAREYIGLTVYYLMGRTSALLPGPRD
jgi:uncharacterized SAM-binding protein YcdF (DUF218 family)